MPQKSSKKVSLLEIIACQLAPSSCFYLEENTSDRQSMCQKTVQRFFLSFREIFNTLIAFTVINKYGKSGLI